MHRWCLGVVAACLLAVPGGISAGGSPPADGAHPQDLQRVPWVHLRCEARNGAVKLAIDLRLRQMASVQVEQAMIDLP